MSKAPNPSEPPAVADYFRSVDSAPVDYAVDRPSSGTNGFFVVFAGLCIIAMLMRTIGEHTGMAAGPGDIVLFAADRGDAAVPTRLFLVLFFVTYAGFAYSNGWRRLFIGGALIGKFAVFCLVLDAFGWLLHALGVMTIPTFGLQMISGLAALAIFPHTVMRQAQLPAEGAPPLRPYTPISAYLILSFSLVFAIVGAAVALWVFGSQVDALQQVAILGGIGPGVFLVQQLLACLTAGFGLRRLRKMKGVTFSPRIAVIVPAHNEAHDIGDTIASVDRAAQTYSGAIHLYVIDNASSDETTPVAESAIAACENITGVVLQCPTPGKAIALNMGIAQITEDFIVRIDADTVIGPDCLQNAMRHFVNPRVGSVGGMPLPAEEKTWIDKVRLVEVFLRHGFFQMSLNGYQGVLGVPGMFTVYRHSALREVGPMVQGMNGEDTDICLRLDSAGYHTVADPTAVYYSETPLSYAHLREQRTRWFRSIYHITAHNRSTLLDRRSMTGTFVLPFQLVNAARRAMLAPLLLFAVIAEVGFHMTFLGMAWQPVVATVLGMPMVVTVCVCLAIRPSAVKYVPAYLCFRVLRSYFTLAAALSLRYPPMQPKDILGAVSAAAPRRRSRPPR
ncbi:glycosyltransferase family 2 protein [Gordonia sp. (in: high G+C Gram-positive bacteria)]|uniref:glycosyltransferase family 2 protein n=1 Tax=Gordonia sp. (in: high G+C Gram-positive bacteria) TaxID=84139 RepID=UPI00168FF6A0|nr:glycosyltransferase family 2 protein [Gordonia sp. (in: high G+C Gram-positive bacteria)]NLG46274.1 glycosyltransferase family 2 protein [Gordonia sp. (in: high G+C Gram-positive bacteria)]